jgi:hypothetical protein
LQQNQYNFPLAKTPILCVPVSLAAEHCVERSDTQSEHVYRAASENSQNVPDMQHSPFFPEERAGFFSTLSSFFR